MSATLETYIESMKSISLRTLIICIAVGLLACGVSYRMGLEKGKTAQSPTVLINTEVPASTTSDMKQLDFSLFWDVWRRLSQSYVDKAAMEPQTMFYGAISGMVASLGDPYTSFLTPTENKDAKDDLGGNFDGIGAQLGMKDERVIVIAPLKDHPAEKAGIKAGDWILKVNDEETINWTLPKAVSKIRGPKGSAVKLNILHEGGDKPVDVSVVRDSIHVESAELDNTLASCGGNSTASQSSCLVQEATCEGCYAVPVIRLSRFGDTTNTEWDAIIEQIVSKNCTKSNKACPGIVLDMRNNPGGYLQGSVYVASEFIERGIVVSQQGRDGSKQSYNVNRKRNLLTVPMVVLVNKGTASASEIVAGALKVHKRAKIVGETTFGKGSVQEPQDLIGGAGLHITVAKWLLPDGSQISGKGIEPDVVIEPSEENPEQDVQLEKAIEVLVGS